MNLKMNNKKILNIFTIIALILIVIVLGGIVYGYYDRDDFYYLDRLDVDVSKKEELREMNVMELRQEIALKIKIFVANSN